MICKHCGKDIQDIKLISHNVETRSVTTYCCGHCYTDIHITQEDFIEFMQEQERKEKLNIAVDESYALTSVSDKGVRTLSCRTCGRTITEIKSLQRNTAIYDVNTLADGEIEFEHRENVDEGDRYMISWNCGHTLGPWDDNVAHAIFDELEKQQEGK